MWGTGGALCAAAALFAWIRLERALWAIDRRLVHLWRCIEGRDRWEVRPAIVGRS